jgi:hypothetical protein
VVKPCGFGYSVVFGGWAVFFGFHGFGVSAGVWRVCVRVVYGAEVCGS